MRQRLVVQSQGEDYVTSDLACVKLAVEASQLHRAVAGEKAVQVEEVVAAVVVMPVAAFTVALVPDLLNRPQGFGLSAVHLLHQQAVHLLAVAHPLRRNLQRFVEKVILAGDDVHEVADAARRVACPVKVEVDAAGGAREGSGLAQFAHQLLQGGDVLAVGEDGADQLHAVFAAGRNPLPSLPHLAGDAAVAHELPDPAVRRCDLLGVVGVGCARHRSGEVFRRDARRLASGDARELDLNPESSR